jgi:hypothetical protein
MQRWICRQVELCGELVLVKQPAEPVAPPHPQRLASERRRRLCEWRSLLEGAVRPVSVVVLDVLAQDSLEVLSGDDQ